VNQLLLLEVNHQLYAHSANLKRIFHWFPFQNGNPKFDASPECLIPLGLAFILGGVSVIENSKNIQKPDT
jgi:hypothetical protein